MLLRQSMVRINVTLHNHKCIHAMALLHLNQCRILVESSEAGQNQSGFLDMCNQARNLDLLQWQVKIEEKNDD